MTYFKNLRIVMALNLPSMFFIQKTKIREFKNQRQTNSAQTTKIDTHIYKYFHSKFFDWSHKVYILILIHPWICMVSFVNEYQFVSFLTAYHNKATEF